MALGRHKDRQSELLVTWAEMPRSPGHAFYDRLQAELLSAGFDGFVEGECAPYYAARQGRPSLPRRSNSKPPWCHFSPPFRAPAGNCRTPYDTAKPPNASALAFAGPAMLTSRAHMCRAHPQVAGARGCPLMGDFSPRPPPRHDT